MSRKAGQIVARGNRTWLLRVFLGRDRDTGVRKYRNRTVHGSVRQAQAALNQMLQERDLHRLTDYRQRCHLRSLARDYETEPSGSPRNSG